MLRIAVGARNPVAVLIVVALRAGLLGGGRGNRSGTVAGIVVGIRVARVVRVGGIIGISAVVDVVRIVGVAVGNAETEVDAAVAPIAAITRAPVVEAGRCVAAT